ncbi:hypothetical protein D3C72_511190 [compost metagenome]
MQELIVSGLVGGVAGGIGGWATAYINWDIFKLKERRDRRRTLIDDARKDLLSGWDISSETAIISPGGHEICHHPTYVRLRPHLSSELIKQLEGAPQTDHSTIVVMMGGQAWLRNALIQEIADLELGWDLI